MARAPYERVSKAYELYKEGLKLVEIASQLNLPDALFERWKNAEKFLFFSKYLQEETITGNNQEIEDTGMDFLVVQKIYGDLMKIKRLKYC